MDALTLKNFRCFFDLQPLPLRPLTLLVGENSTGKSSFLAAIRLAWDTAYNRGKRIDFNEEPFLLGAFDQIAHYRGGRAGRAGSFEIGFQTQRRRTKGSDKFSVPMRYNTVFRQSGSHAMIESQTLTFDNYFLSISFDSVTNQPNLTLEVDDKRASASFKDVGIPYRFGPDAPLDWSYLLFLISRPKATEKKLVEFESLANSSLEILEEIRRATSVGAKRRPIAIAPVRTRPQRTYNPISETPLPEGDHVPMVLARTYFSDKDHWARLSDALDVFGADSGMYSGIAIKALGDSESDPFQLRVKIEGPAANLVDVGYGVSQVLPILVDALVSDRGSEFLLQQPEVHLHPRAQAALGSFLARSAGKQGKRFILETHSDHLIDRIRSVVREGKTIKSDDVSILFFERRGIEVGIHHMTIDELGNLENAPPNYRKFFLDEESRFLGV